MQPTQRERDREEPDRELESDRERNVRKKKLPVVEYRIEEQNSCTEGGSGGALEMIENVCGPPKNTLVGILYLF